MEAAVATKNTNVLYYSIVFPEQYDTFLKCVFEKILGTTQNSTKGLFVKTETGIIPYFRTSFSNEDIETILSTHKKIISQFKQNEIFVLFNNIIYKVNDEFHITTLFTGGSQHEKSSEMKMQSSKELKIQLNKIAISNDFIVFGVADFDCSYYGNPVKHITFGLAKSEKKVFPKDSPNAFIDGKNIDINVTLVGLTSKFCQVVKIQHNNTKTNTKTDKK